MKKAGIINSEIAGVVADMGHFDELAIGDAGMPVPAGTKKIDLAVSNAIPSFLEVLDNILLEMQVQSIYLAEEIKTENPEMLAAIKQRFTVPIEYVPHSQLKLDLGHTKAFIRTGEMTPFANIILVSGVTF